MGSPSTAPPQPTEALLSENVVFQRKCCRPRPQNSCVGLLVPLGTASRGRGAGAGIGRSRCPAHGTPWGEPPTALGVVLALAALVGLPGLPSCDLPFPFCPYRPIVEKPSEALLVLIRHLHQSSMSQLGCVDSRVEIVTPHALQAGMHKRRRHHARKRLGQQPHQPRCLSTERPLSNSSPRVSQTTIEKAPRLTRLALPQAVPAWPY